MEMRSLSFSPHVAYGEITCASQTLLNIERTFHLSIYGVMTDRFLVEGKNLYLNILFFSMFKVLLYDEKKISFFLDSDLIFCKNAPC